MVRRRSPCGVVAACATLSIPLLGCSLFTSLDPLNEGRGGDGAGAAGSGGAIGGAGGDACGAGHKLCAGECVATDDPLVGCDQAACSACTFDQAAATCVDGACAIDACASAYDDCDGNPANGCEVSLASDEHCSSCDNDCTANSATPFCSAGVCSATKCADGTGDCDGNPANGCETQVASDPMHCALCTISCNLPQASVACQDGVCVVLGCQQGFGDCDGNDANGCETPLAADANHCGACGHGCLGGGCSGGACQPVEIATGQASPWGIAVDDTSVYWTNPGSGDVRKRAKNGTGVIVTLASTQNSPWGIALDANQVYFANFAPTGGVVSVGKDGAGLSVLATGQPSPPMLTVTGQDVFFTNVGSTLPVKRVGTAGGPVTIVADAQQAYGILADSSSVYWPAHYNSIQRYDKSSTQLGELLGGLNHPVGLAVDATTLFYSEYRVDGSVGRVDKSTGANHVVLATQQDSPTGVAADATYVYWTTEGGSVMRAAKDGSVVTTLASSQVEPRGVAVDDTAIYWVSHQASGAVMRLAK